jgi:class 3 adenylate cyclase
MASQTRHLTILLTDIKGFTDKTSARSRADIVRMLDEHREAVLPVLQERGGRLVKTIGDAFLMVFDSPTDAVLAGTAAQAALARRNEGRADEDRIDIRIAINCGEVSLVEGDVFGEPVNITARIEGVAEAGEVFFTEAVYLTMNKAEVPSSEVGLLQLKGIPEKIRVYKVRRETPLGVNQAAPAKGGRRSSDLAPGEKARLVPAGPAEHPPGTKHPTPEARALFKKRARALVVDFFLVTLIASGVSDVLADMGVDRGSARMEAVIDSAVDGMTDGDGKQVTRAVKELARESARSETGRGRRFSLTPLLFLLMNALCVWRLGGVTPGKRLVGLRVVAENGGPVSGQDAFLRAGVSLVSFYTFALGYLWAWKDPQARTWHDLIARTRVVPAEPA